MRRTKLLIVVGFAVATLTVATVRPVTAGDMSCAEWLAYRMGDKSAQGAGFALTTFLQGYIDAVNEFGDAFNGLLISEVSPGKFAPTPPMRPAVLESTVAKLDRKCTENRSQSVHVLAASEVQSEMYRRATPIVNSMRTILRNLNDAKGYK
jgi:hypothetical protein